MQLVDAISSRVAPSIEAVYEALESYDANVVLAPPQFAQGVQLPIVLSPGWLDPDNDVNANTGLCAAESMHTTAPPPMASGVVHFICKRCCARR